MKKASSAVLIVVILIAIAILAFVYIKDKAPTSVDIGVGEEAQLSEGEIESLIKAVKKHIVLPDDEEPLVATIVNVDELLAEQAFYEGAQNGDVLMIYGSIAKALIYNPREDRLVNVGPVQVEESASAPAIPATETIGE